MSELYMLGRKKLRCVELKRFILRGSKKLPKLGHPTPYFNVPAMFLQCSFKGPGTDQL